MSLQGSLETIALPDVLSLLASSSKTGELRITGRVNGQLWLEEGKLIASRVGPAIGPQGRSGRPGRPGQPGQPGQPEPGRVDDVFQLLRLSRGDFLFEEGSSPAEPGEMSQVDGVVRQAQARLAEWRIIESAVPSLDAQARLRSDLAGSEVTLTADQWRLVVTIAGGLSVRETLEKLGLGEFDGCRGLKQLIDGDLVTIEAPQVRVSSVAPVSPVAAVVPVAAAAPFAGEPARVRRRPLVATATAVNGTGEMNGRSVAASADLASAVVALQNRPARTRPTLPATPEVPVTPAAALKEALAAVAEELPNDDWTAARQVDSSRARRARRVAAVDSASPEPVQAVRPVPAVVDPPAAVAEAAVTVPASAPRHDKELPGEEPINRGLLLKFLSSVRS